MTPLPPKKETLEMVKIQRKWRWRFSTAYLLFKRLSVGARGPSGTGIAAKPLHIDIPDASSPNKFLPTNPRLDTSNIFQPTTAGGQVDSVGFLQGLQG